MAEIGLQHAKLHRVVMVNVDAIAFLKPLPDNTTEMELKSGARVTVLESVPQIRAMIAVPFVPPRKRTAANLGGVVRSVR